MPAFTPDEELKPLQGFAKRGSQLPELAEETPETPEVLRQLQSDAPFTQVSSPRKGRSMSAQKRRRALEKDDRVPSVAKSLIDGPLKPNAPSPPTGEKSGKSLQEIGKVRDKLDRVRTTEETNGKKNAGVSDGDAMGADQLPLENEEQPRKKRRL